MTHINKESSPLHCKKTKEIFNNEAKMEFKLEKHDLPFIEDGNIFNKL